MLVTDCVQIIHFGAGLSYADVQKGRLGVYFGKAQLPYRKCHSQKSLILKDCCKTGFDRFVIRKKIMAPNLIICTPGLIALAPNWAFCTHRILTMFFSPTGT